MRFIIGIFILFLSISNLFSAIYYNYHQPGHDSGYLRSGDIKRFRYVIPQGYKAKIHFKAATNNNGTDEVKMNYLSSGFVTSENIMPRFSSNRTEYIVGCCTQNRDIYVKLSRNTYDTNCHYELDVNYIPMPQCTRATPDVSDDHILRLNKSKSKSMNKNDLHRYTLEHPVEGVVTVKLDNLTNDLDLYTGIQKGGIGVAILHKKWDCRPWYSGKSIEECTTIMKKSDYLDVVVHGYSTGSYRLTATKTDLKNLSVGDSDSSYVGYKKWRYYKVSNPNGIKKLVARLENLRSDVDLYIRKGKLPTYKKYDCRSWNSGSRNEECKITASSSDDVIYIGVRGYQSGSYTVSLNEVPRKRATILLHGLASSSETWNSLISSKFRGKCTKIFGGRLSSSPQPFGVEEYCFKVDFGAYDRKSSLKNILGKSCLIDTGCRGDYVTFDTLGKEVESAVKSVLSKLGNDTDITLVGHSRGGLAASAYIGRSGYGVQNVKALLTTGTPFLGSPLGKINSYMKTFCLPYSTKIHERYFKQDWEARQFLIDAEKPGEGLDVTVPSVGFLEEGSSSLAEIFSADRIKSIQSGIRDYKSLIYKGVPLGNLAQKSILVYNAFPSISGALNHVPTVKTFSEIAEKYILGDYPQSRVIELSGDGIVPKKNQDIASISISESSTQFVDYGSGANRWSSGVPTIKVTKFNSKNRVSIEYNKNILHVQEPKRTEELSKALDDLWMRQSRYMEKTLSPAIVDTFRGLVFGGTI